MSMSVEVIEQVTSVVEISETEAVVTTETQMNTVEVGIAGPQGPQGATGAPGPQGPAGPSGQSYTHTQVTPAAVWTINHNLGFYPNVTVVDSGGSVVEGDEAYPDANTVILTFSGAFAGQAFLS